MEGKKTHAVSLACACLTNSHENLTRCAIAGHSHNPFEISEVGSIFCIGQAVPFFSFFFSPSNGTLARAFPHCIHFSSPKPIIFPLIRHGLIDIQANDLYTYHPVVLPPGTKIYLIFAFPIYAFPQDMIRPPLVQWNDSLFSCVPTGSLLRAHRHPSYGNRVPIYSRECVRSTPSTKALYACRVQLLLWYGVREYGARSPI